MTRFRQFIMESTRSKAGILPYYMDGDTRKFLFMISSDPAFGGSDPMISKGKIDAGESSLQAALREGEEELGLKHSMGRRRPGGQEWSADSMNDIACAFILAR